MLGAPPRRCCADGLVLLVSWGRNGLRAAPKSSATPDGETWSWSRPRHTERPGAPAAKTRPQDTRRRMLGRCCTTSCGGASGRDLVARGESRQRGMAFHGFGAHATCFAQSGTNDSLGGVFWPAKTFEVRSTIHSFLSSHMLADVRSRLVAWPPTQIQRPRGCISGEGPWDSVQTACVASAARAVGALVARACAARAHGPQAACTGGMRVPSSRPT